MTFVFFYDINFLCSIRKTNMQKHISNAITQDDISDKLSPENLLWRAVIMQALVDLRIKSNRKSQYKYWRKKAYQWLTERDEDFYMVCSLANFEPEDLIKKINKIVKELGYTHEELI